METIGQRIAYLRKYEEWSQRELATRLGTSQKQVALWEIDRAEPSIKYVVLLSEIFSCSADYLLGIKKDFS